MLPGGMAQRPSSSRQGSTLLLTDVNAVSNTQGCTDEESHNLGVSSNLHAALSPTGRKPMRQPDSMPYRMSQPRRPLHTLPGLPYRNSSPRASESSPSWTLAQTTAACRIS